MIHPATLSSSFQNISSKNKKLVIFYTIAVILNVANFIPTINSTINDIESPDIAIDCLIWYQYCFVLSIPMMVEYVLDLLVYFKNPDFYQNITDHRFGHGLLLLSMALPLVIVCVEPPGAHHVDFTFSVCFVEALCALALTAIYGKLQVYSDGAWKARSSLFIISLLLVSQLVLNFAVGDCQTDVDCLNGVSDSEVKGSITFAAAALVAHLICARKEIYHLLSYLCDRCPEATITSNQYTCSILIFSVATYLLVRVILLSVYLASDYPMNTLEVTQIAMHMAFTLSAAVLPGRMINRGMGALKVRTLLEIDLKF